jgi:hypothetical protein
MFPKSRVGLVRGATMTSALLRKRREIAPEIMTWETAEGARAREAVRAL